MGLATLVETLLGYRLAKEHSAVDWSTRPLPAPWLEYAALDVEVLVELRDALDAELVETGKADWARQEFDYLRTFEQPARVEAWRRTSGLHRVRGRRALGAVRALWEARDEIAAQRDVTPGRIIPDAAIVAAAQAMPGDRAALLATKGFHGRGAERYATRWVSALREVQAMDEADLPTRSPRGDGPPLPRAWAEKDPVAARRLQLAREAMGVVAEQPRAAGREHPHPRLPAAHAVDAARDAGARRPAGRRGRDAPGVRRPQLADRPGGAGPHPGDPGCGRERTRTTAEAADGGSDSAE